MSAAVPGAGAAAPAGVDPWYWGVDTHWSDLGGVIAVQAVEGP